MFHAQNEPKYMDLENHLDTLETLGVNPTTAFPTVLDAMGRVDQLEQTSSTYRANPPEINSEARRLGLTTNLDDTAAILAEADHVAYGQDEAHRQRVLDYLENATDFARGEALRQFRRSPILDLMRPAFDATAARITAAAETIPQGVMNLEDAARLGHADTYLQLERDIATWKQTGELIGELTAAGTLSTDHPRWPVEFMVDDLDAYREASAGSSRVTRTAAGIAAGRPNLHTPTGAPIPAPDDRDTRNAVYRANDDDHAAREALGLKK